MSDFYSYLTEDKPVKVFISWSGEKSKAVAKLLKTWISDMIQAIDPWVSDDNLERGVIWFSEISKALREVDVGIICLTEENKNAPWILFETGALSGGADDPRICTFLVDLDPADVQQPLSQYNHTFPTKESLYSLIKTLNSKLDKDQLDTAKLNRIFEHSWTEFETKFNEILKQYGDNKPPKPKTREELLLEEVLYSVRTIEKKLASTPVMPSSSDVADETINKIASYWGQWQKY